jgi:hypothetical protein
MQEGNSLFNKCKAFIRNTKGILFTIILLGAVILLFTMAVSGAAEKADESATATLESAIRRAAVQCYAIEGFYPVSIEYLVENYGVIIDDTKFAIFYEAKMKDKMPVIRVGRIDAAIN